MPVRAKNRSSVTARFDIGRLRFRLSARQFAVRYGCRRAGEKGASLGRGRGRQVSGAAAALATKCGAASQPCPSCRCGKLWCTVLPGCRRCSEAEERRRHAARPGGPKPALRKDRSRDCPKRGFGKRGISPGRWSTTRSVLVEEGLQGHDAVDEVFQAARAGAGAADRHLLSGSPRSCWRACRRPVGPGDRRTGSSGCSLRRRRSRRRFTHLHDELLVIIFAITRLRPGAAALCDRAVPRQPQPGAEPHRAQHGDRNSVDRGAGADPGHHRDPVVPADVLHGPGAGRRDDDQGHRKPVVLDAMPTPTRATSASTATSSRKRI